MRAQAEQILTLLRGSFLLRWTLANILGWSLGLYLGALILSYIGGIGGLFLGGLIAGGIGGTAQWLSLTPSITPDGRRWIAYSMAGGGCGAILVFLVVIVGGLVGMMLILAAGLSSGVVAFFPGAAFGAIVGWMQTFVLRRWMDDLAFWWLVANALAGGLCAALSLPSSSLWLPILCSPGPLAFGLITGTVLLRLLPEVAKTDIE